MFILKLSIKTRDFQVQPRHFLIDSTVLVQYGTEPIITGSDDHDNFFTLNTRYGTGTIPYGATQFSSNLLMIVRNQTDYSGDSFLLRQDSLTVQNHNDILNFT